MWKPLAKLEKWAVVDKVVSLSFQELQPGRHLMGYVSGHANLPNAKLIYTSAIVSIDASKGQIETRNSVYELGEPNDAYKTWIQEKHATAVA